MTTLSFHKVMFTAQEILDMISELPDDATLAAFTDDFARAAEDRSRTPAVRVITFMPPPADST